MNPPQLTHSHPEVRSDEKITGIQLGSFATTTARLMKELRSVCDYFYPSSGRARVSGFPRSTSVNDLVKRALFDEDPPLGNIYGAQCFSSGGVLRVLHQRRTFIIVAVRGDERQKSLAADALRVKAITFVCR